jgi:hypothetical protein
MAGLMPDVEEKNAVISPILPYIAEVLRTQPDIAASWSDWEVASRWLQICPPKPGSKKKQALPIEVQINALLASPARIAELRKRLCSLSWFMGRLNEFIVRMARNRSGLHEQALSVAGRPDSGISMECAYPTYRAWGWMFFLRSMIFLARKIELCKMGPYTTLPANQRRSAEQNQKGGVVHERTHHCFYGFHCPDCDLLFCHSHQPEPCGCDLTARREKFCNRQPGSHPVDHCR